MDNFYGAARRTLVPFLCAPFFLLSGFPPLHAYEDTLTAQDVEGALANTKVTGILGQYLATVQMYDPERATRMGIHGADSSLTQRTPERLAKELEALTKLRTKLADVSKASMYPDLQVDYDLLDHILEVDIYDMENRDLLAKRPQYYLEPLFSVYELLSKDFDDYNVRAGDAISRLKQFPQVLEQAERNLDHPPRIWTEQALQQTEDALGGVSDFIPLFRGYTRYDPVLKTKVDDTLEEVKTALSRYRDFLKSEVLPGSDGDFRAGKYTYGFYLERWHRLDMTPGAAVRYARKRCKAALKDLRKEAENVDASLARERGWKGVLANLPKEHPALADVLKVFQDEVDRAYQHFDNYKVVEYPQQRLLFRKMPDFMTSVLPYVYFSAPFDLDDERVSELFLSLPSEKLSPAARERVLSSGFNYAQIELLVAFDLMPGMHLRAYSAEANPSKIRKIADQPMIVNGWACYAELLAEEMGYYSTYWSRFLRIYVRALRCGRAYADAALHTGAMTYGEAVTFFQDEFHMSEGQARAEVLRISAAPTESLSYIVGMDRILGMRGYFRNKEEKYFDLREFHSAFLRQGKVPLPAAEAELKRLRKEARKMIE